MHGPFLAVSALLLAISTVIPIRGQASGSGKTDAPNGSFVEVDADIPDVHAHAGVIEAGIYGSRRVVLTDAGHLMYLEKPEEFSSLVIGFIRLNRR
jgi:pimeloyl-ACP methyl ester carboxylesterase